MKIILAAVAVVVVLTLWFERQSPPIDLSRVHSSVFRIQSIDKALSHYHAYSAVDQGNKQWIRLCCFGACPAMGVGQKWLLYYKFNQSVSRHCLHFLCQHPFWFDKKATIVKSKQAQLLSVGKLNGWQRQHERYLQLLSVWFEQKSVVAVFAALTLNDKRFFTRDIWRVFKNTGTSHLVAMSGLHVGLLVSLVGRLLLGALVLVFPQLTDRWIHWLRAGLVLLIAVLLFLLVNASSSIERALLMFVGSAAVIGFRGHLSLHKWWVISAVLLMVLSPGVVFSVGAWLSFLTVWALIRYSKSLTQYESLWVVSAGQCGLVFVFLLPVTLYFFRATSIWAPLINMIAVPWFSLTVIPLLVLSLGASFVSVLAAKQLAWLANLFFQPMWLLLSKVAQWPGTQLSVPDFPLWVCALSLLVLVRIMDQLMIGRAR